MLSSREGPGRLLDFAPIASEVPAEDSQLRARRRGRLRGCLLLGLNKGPQAPLVCSDGDPISLGPLPLSCEHITPTAAEIRSPGRWYAPYACLGIGAFLHTLLFHPIRSRLVLATWMLLAALWNC